MNKNITADNHTSKLNQEALKKRDAINNDPVAKALRDNLKKRKQQQVNRNKFTADSNNLKDN